MALDLVYHVRLNIDISHRGNFESNGSKLSSLLNNVRFFEGL